MMLEKVRLRSYMLHCVYLGAGGHSLRRLSCESLGQVPDDALKLHDEHRCFRVVRVIVHLAANLVLVLAYHVSVWGQEFVVYRMSFVSNNTGTTARGCYTWYASSYHYTRVYASPRVCLL